MWPALRGTTVEAVSPDGKLLQEPRQEKVEAGRRRRAGWKNEKWLNSRCVLMVELTTLAHDLDTGCEKRERSRMTPTRLWAPQGLEICLICLHIFNVWRNTGFGIRRDLSSNLAPLLPGWLSSVQSLSHVQLFAIPWTTEHQAALAITNSQSPPKPMSIESVMPSNHLIFCHPLLLLPSIFPSIRVFSNESALHIRWPKYWSFSFSISPSSKHPGLISFRMDWLGLLAVQGPCENYPSLVVLAKQCSP